MFGVYVFKVWIIPGTECAGTYCARSHGVGTDRTSTIARVFIKYGCYTKKIGKSRKERELSSNDTHGTGSRDIV